MTITIDIVGKTVNNGYPLVPHIIWQIKAKLVARRTAIQKITSILSNVRTTAINI